MLATCFSASGGRPCAFCSSPTSTSRASTASRRRFRRFVAISPRSAARPGWSRRAIRSAWHDDARTAAPAVALPRLRSRRPHDVRPRGASSVSLGLARDRGRAHPHAVRRALGRHERSRAALRVPLLETYHTFFEAYLHHYVPLLPALARARVRARGVAAPVQRRRRGRRAVAAARRRADELRRASGRST